MPTPPENPDCIETGFRTPAFWDRSVTYFANLKSLFFGNEEQTEELARQVGEIDSYGGRLASVIDLIYPGGDNALALERRPDPSLLRYFETGLGLSLPRIVPLAYDDYARGSVDAERVRESLGRSLQWVDGYVTDDRLVEWAEAGGGRTVSSCAGSREGNNKTLLYQFVKESDLPTPDTKVASDESSVSSGLRWLERLGYRNAVIRSALGASGIGMLKVALGEASPLPLPRMLFHGGPCLTQGWFEPGVKSVSAVSSPSVQLFLDDERVQLFDVTDQILSTESIHEGNQSPPVSMEVELQQELIRQAKVAGRWLHGRGYRGTASVDFLVVDGEGDSTPTVYICELNARITGATYPSVLGRHLLPGGAWLMQNLRLEEPIEGERLLGLIEKARLLFTQGDGRGVVPINFNFDREGRTRKGQFLCLSSSVEECRSIMDTLVAALPFTTHLERD